MRKIEKIVKKDILNRIKYIDSILLIIKKNIKKTINKISKIPEKIENIVNQKSFETKTAQKLQYWQRNRCDRRNC